MKTPKLCGVRGITGKIFWGGKVIFPDFFPCVKCFSPVENFHFDRPKTNFSRFEKWQEKKKSSPRFGTFPPSIFNFTPTPSLSCYNFSSFLLHFSPVPFFPSLFFPGWSAKISQSEVSGGFLPPCYATVWSAAMHSNQNNGIFKFRLEDYFLLCPMINAVLFHIEWLCQNVGNVDDTGLLGISCWSLVMLSDWVRVQAII